MGNDEVGADDVLMREVHSRPIGLCLSGGGSRAMAFHLGCLRAMHERGTLSKVDVVSTVSGGSVIGAMYAYSNGLFRGIRVSRAGCTQARVCEKHRASVVFSPMLPKVFATKIVAGTASCGTFALRKGIGLVERLLPKSSRAKTNIFRVGFQPPFRRWASRTTAFEAALEKRLFGKRLVDSERRNDINVVINACELRSGTAFRFGNRETGSWRFGTIEKNERKQSHSRSLLRRPTQPCYRPLIASFDSYMVENRIRRVIE